MDYLEVAAHRASVYGNHPQTEETRRESRVAQFAPCDHPALRPKN